ncbi:putative inorganic phosphate cotransporter [Pararge aegeria]|uniref:Putative inorganic phosphate cotransporter n=1 Tax=Pararge aegeria aegeria TaxID=348720 RepID=A0A8S4R111_9NEOP|nr:putative inorganic phosphate cotransporter [Pararge aegeria]CAH2229075.1 jg19856 [Pararge aegeria aegeria]
MKNCDGGSEKRYGFGVRHIQMACMCLTMVALFIARSSLGVAILAMTDMRRRNDTNVIVYEWDKKTQGMILSSFFWGYLIMQIPAGLLAKRYGGKPIVLFSLLANAIICALLPTLVQFGGWQVVCACRVIMGLTQACLFPGFHTLLGQWLPAHEITSYSGIVYGGSQIGTIIAMPVSGLLAETAMGWKLIFYVVSGIMFLQSIIWIFFAASSPRDHRLMTEGEKEYIERGLNAGGSKSHRTPWRYILRTKALWGIMFTHIGCAISYVLFFVDMPTYLERGLQISLKDSASLSALPYIGMFIGNIASTSVSQKIYNKGYLSLLTCRKLFNSLGFFGTAFSLIALSFIGPEHKSLAIVTLIIALTLNGFFGAGFMMSYLDLSPNYAGVMLSITNFAANFGSVLTPITTSLILKNDPTDISRWRIVFLTCAAICIAANTSFMFFASVKRQEWDDPDFLDKIKADPEEVKPALTKTKEEANSK